MCVLCLTPVPVQCSRNLNVLGLFTNGPFSSPCPRLVFFKVIMSWLSLLLAKQT